MKKKVFLLAILFSLVMFILPLIFAANQTQVSKAYSCLSKQVAAKGCDKLSTQEMIFSKLAVGKCGKELSSSVSQNNCWPNSGCKIKDTAQAILALGGSTDAESWLLSETLTPSNLIWYLQIETDGESSCEIDYASEQYFINIGDDRKIQGSSLGQCLSVSPGGYWLQVSPSCSGKEFQISCDNDFLTNLLFTKKGSSVVQVLDKTNSASGGGTTTEKINSACFGAGSSCDYEGSLWAALVLQYEGQDVSPYLPYLDAMATDNEKYFPEVFLYLLTGYEDFYTEIISKQALSGYWQVSGNKYYDTALVLQVSGNLSQKRAKAQNWLLTSAVQGEDGCWDSDNILETAFILYSAWPREIPVSKDCESANHYCMSAIDCDGNILSDYDCPGFYKCCDTEKKLETCDDLGGTECQTDETCSGASLDASDSVSCCSGTCEKKQQPPAYDCETSGGTCETSECSTGYKETDAYTCSGGDICCIESSAPSKGKLWIFVLLILIVLAIIGIVLKDKLRKFWLRFKSGFGGHKRPPAGPPSRPSSFYLRHPIHRRFEPRRILPPEEYHPVRRPALRKSGDKEFNDVLKKLKEMGK